MTFPHDAPAPSPPPIPKRAPATPVESWACDGVVLLAGMDPDGASAINGCGPGKTDVEFVHSLADQLKRWGVLSEKQFAAAIRLARKYRRQLPPEPPAMFAAAPGGRPRASDMTVISETGVRTVEEPFLPADPPPAPAPPAAPAPVWPAGENAPHASPPAVSAPRVGGMVPGDAARARARAEQAATVANFSARLHAITGDLIPRTDPAFGARCIRAREPGTDGRLAYCCRGCELGPNARDKAFAARARNNVCVGLELWMLERLELHRLDGDFDGQNGPDARAVAENNALMFVQPDAECLGWEAAMRVGDGAADAHGATSVPPVLPARA